MNTMNSLVNDIIELHESKRALQEKVTQLEGALKELNLLVKRNADLEFVLQKYKDVAILGPDESGDYSAPVQRFLAKEVLESKR